MKPIPQTRLRLRITLLLYILLSLFVIVLARSYQLQVLQSKKLATLAERQYQRIMPLEPRRGILYDRKGEEMAITIEVDSVFVQPERISDPHSASLKLAPILGKRTESVLQRLKEDKPFVWLERGVTPEKRAALEKVNVDGVEFLKESKRFYPQGGGIAAHVMGFAGVDSQGLEGIELGYNEFIRGEPGFVLISKDALGRPISAENLQFRHSEEGCEIVMTLDKNIQYIAEKELRKAVAASSARGGMVVVMNPKTGEILAMAVQPSFDPNQFSAAAPQFRKNRTITDTFEPGSTFKVFLLAAALEERVSSPGDLFFCENGLASIGGRVIHDVHRYGWLSLAEIIKFSSNIGASKVGKKLGRTKLHQYLKSFGFGGKSGIDLPGEVPGFLPPPNYWSEVGLANISFGQGVSLTALQITNAFAAIANGGVLMRPYVVQNIVQPPGKIVKENRPKAIRRVLSPETAKTVAGILKTVTEEGGTGKAAAPAGYEAGGKTGTAQKALENGRGYSSKRIGSFIGFAPVDNPELVISVIIDEPRGVVYGGVVAAPAFRAIAQQVLPLLGAYPKGTTILTKVDAPKNLPEITNGSSPEGKGRTEEPGVMPDFSGQTMRQVLQAAKRLDLDLRFEGTGKAVAQEPAPGQALQGNKGLVRFQPAI
jgi:cell division protein FtsI (penicillin-binding protein 3)